MATKKAELETGAYRWPEEGLTHIPDWIYTSDEIFARERERIFLGPTWNFVALEAEIPDPGSFKRSYVGDVPVIVTRDEHGEIHAFENRCAHRGVEFCRALRGKAENFICPYHQWTYDLGGRLMAVPFRRGDRGKGGMPKDFKLEDHNPRKLTLAIRHGVVFASFADDMESLEDYLGPENLEQFDVVFAGRKLKILGFYRNRLNGNWKLYHENLKDPYHATLLHVYLATFRLMVAGQKSAMIVDARGRHATAASAKDDDIEISLENNTVDIYFSALRGKPTSLIPKQSTHLIERSSKVWMTWESWCREVVWFGNKKGDYLYGSQNVEKYFAGHY